MPEPGLVSVVMIVRNGARFLGQALESVQAQRYRPLEILVVDGQSTDGSGAIAGSHPGARLIRQAQGGIADAYNLGIAESRGEFVAFLSHDDLWAPEKLALQVGHLLADPELQYVVAKLRYFLEPGCLPPRGFNSALLEGDHVGRVMETLVARRTLFDSVGGFDPAYRIANDVDWFARVQDLGIPGAVLPAVLLHKRVHDSNASSSEAANTPELLAVLRRSIARRRVSAAPPQ
jgi:glycosyltransferase involved in cell wall biosynthesis